MDDPSRFGYRDGPMANVSGILVSQRMFGLAVAQLAVDAEMKRG